MFDALDDFLTFRREVQGCAPNTLRQDRGQLRSFLRHCAAEDVSLERVDLACLRQFLLQAAEGLQRGSVMQKVMALKQFFAFCHRTGRLGTNPARALIPPRTERLAQMPYVPSREEVATVLGNALVTGSAFHRARNFAALQLLYATGLRPFELIRLDVGDVDLADRAVCVRLRKNSNAQRLPLLDCAADALESYLPQRDRRPGVDPQALFVGQSGARWSVGSLGYALRVLREGVSEHFTPYSLRHAFATHLLQSGSVSLFQLQQLLGHGKPGTTLYYLHLTPERVRPEVERLHSVNTFTRVSGERGKEVAT